MYGLPKTRQEARDANSKAYFTGLFCKQGHVAKRWTATGNCSECQRKHTKQWTDANPEKVQAFINSDKQREKNRIYGRAYYEKHKAYYIAKDAKRYAAQRQATTKWGQDGILEFYKKAKELERQNPGTKYHVDHIVPICGVLVCGLHNKFNLQILTEDANKRKYNKHEV